MAYVGPEYTQGAHKELSIRPRFNGGSPLLCGLEGYWPGVEGGGKVGIDISPRQCYGNGTQYFSRAVISKFSQTFSLTQDSTSVLSIPCSQITQHCTNAGRMTFSIWMRSSYATLAVDPILSVVNFGTLQKSKWALFVRNSGADANMELVLTFDGGANEIVLGDQATIPDGYWHNYTCIYDGTSIIAYIDNVFRGLEASGFTANNGENTSLGYAGASYLCDLWGFGVWSRVLTPVEIYNLWREPYLMLAQPPVLRYNQLGGAARIFDLMPFMPM